MAKKVSSLSAIFEALPAVQAEVRAEIAARLAAGETIGRVDGDKIISSYPANCDLAERRKELLEGFASQFGAANGTEIEPEA